MLLALQLNNLLEEEAGEVPVQIEQLPNISAAFDSGTHQYDLSAYFTGATSYAIDPAVETGWSFATDTGILEIDTDAEDLFGPYTVTATNAEGDTESNGFFVNVSESEFRAGGGFGLRIGLHF